MSDPSVDSPENLAQPGDGILGAGGIEPSLQLASPVCILALTKSMRPRELRVESHTDGWVAEEEQLQSAEGPTTFPTTNFS